MYKAQNHTMFVLLKLDAFEFGHKIIFINMDFLGNIIKSKTRVFRKITYVPWIYIAMFFIAFNFNDTEFSI